MLRHRNENKDEGGGDAGGNEEQSVTNSRGNCQDTGISQGGQVRVHHVCMEWHCTVLHRWAVGRQDSCNDTQTVQ